jgi:hypothetical protein
LISTVERKPNMKVNLSPSTIIGGSATGVLTILAFIAGAPPSLQNEIPQLFPEQYRGTIALWLHVLQAVAAMYTAHEASQAAPMPPPAAPGLPAPVAETPAAVPKAPGV